MTGRDYDRKHVRLPKPKRILSLIHTEVLMQLEGSLSVLMPSINKIVDLIVQDFTDESQ